MIKIPRKQSYSPSWAWIILFLLLYFSLPIYFSLHLKAVAFKALSIFYLASIVILFYFLRRNSGQKNRLELKAGDLQEKINLSLDENSRQMKSRAAFQEKMVRYHNLKEIIEGVNQKVALDDIADNLTEAVFSLIAHNKGTCLLYLVDEQTHVDLSLFKSKKEDKKLIIKAKKGDLFDYWVLRHAQPLLVEDVKNDFRFDLGKPEKQEPRPLASLISAPLISEHRFLGILRLDSQFISSYSQDDLRFLVTICDFGAVALENAEFFQKTQDLAIHDGLTGLYRKGYFLERLKEEYKRCLHKNTDLSLLMLDIDHFKNYNDKFGHTAGDIVLKKISLTMADFFKKLNPVISRFGGEEFCVILPHTDKKQACLLAEQLREKIFETEVVLRRQKSHISVSIGISSGPDDAHSEEELVFKADQLLYRAKEAGRNRVMAC